MTLTESILAGGWIIFWVYWIISAAGSKKNAYSSVRIRSIGPRLLLIVLALVLALAKRDFLGNSSLLGSGSGAEAIGFILFALGLLLAVWARVHLGKNWGMPISLKQDPELITSGPYRFIRHPIYSGLLLAILGSALVVGIYWILIYLIVAIVYLVYCALKEEKIMMTQFPKTYPAYKGRTKMLIPFIV